MRRFLLILIATGFVGCDLLTGSSPAVEREQLSGTTWRVQTTSDDALVPPSTRFRFFGENGFAEITPDGTSCGRWQVQDRLLVVDGERDQPLFIADIHEVGPDRLELTVQPHEYYRSAHVVMRGGQLPQNQFESDARSIPDYTVRKDTLGRYVTETGDDWEIWRHSPLFTCGRYRIAAPSPNPVQYGRVSMHVRHGDSPYIRPGGFDPEHLRVKGYDYRGELTPLVDNPDDRVLTFEPSRLMPPGGSLNGPGLFRIIVVDAQDQIVAYGNVVID